ncbi:hypothetical protein [Echinicola pacifica]|uniref:hypothetical protein n=1 Tax=Echinicola pacifica TaxID=346377 RepID=UPI0012FC8814|nr:hypothetical protein [Echinicola pacifica]
MAKCRSYTAGSNDNQTSTCPHERNSFSALPQKAPLPLRLSRKLTYLPLGNWKVDRGKPASYHSFLAFWSSLVSTTEGFTLR